MNVLGSKSVWGVIIAVVAWLLSPPVLATIHNSAIAYILQAVGAILAGIGYRQAIAKAALGNPK